MPEQSIPDPTAYPTYDEARAEAQKTLALAANNGRLMLALHDWIEAETTAQLTRGFGGDHSAAWNASKEAKHRFDIAFAYRVGESMEQRRAAEREGQP